MRSHPMLRAWTLSLVGLSLLGLPCFVFAAPLAPEIAQVRQHLQSGDIDSAVDASEKAVKLHAQDPLAWLWAGRAYGRQAMAANILTKAKWAGRTRDAWETAVRLDPHLLEARFDLMQYYLQAPGIVGGGRDKADAQAAQIAEINPSMGKVASANLALLDKNEAQAEAELRQAIELDTGNHRARMALAGFLQSKERWDEVKALWVQRLSIAADDAAARYQFARYAAITGKDLEAGLGYIDAFIAAGDVPENMSLAAAQWRRGLILEKLGQIGDAESAYELAISDPQIATQAKIDLDRLRKAKG